MVVQTCEEQKDEETLENVKWKQCEKDDDCL